MPWRLRMLLARLIGQRLSRSAWVEQVFVYLARNPNPRATGGGGGKSGGQANGRTAQRISERAGAIQIEQLDGPSSRSPYDQEATHECCVPRFQELHQLSVYLAKLCFAKNLQYVTPRFQGPYHQRRPLWKNPDACRARKIWIRALNIK